MSVRDCHSVLAAFAIGAALAGCDHAAGDSSRPPQATAPSSSSSSSLPPGHPALDTQPGHSDLGALPWGHPALGALPAGHPGLDSLPPGHPSIGTPPQTEPQTEPQAEPQGALAWSDPPGWQRVEPSSRMRRAQYRVPRARGDDADGELVVITFGGGQGGDVDSNLQRWYGQVAQPDGRPSSEVATRRTFTASGMTVTLTEVAGRLAASSMPGVPASPGIEHGRLLAAIVETPQGPWFFKLTGPDATVAGARAAFESMLRSLRVPAATT